MIVLVIVSLIALIAFAFSVAVVIAWESLSLDRTPAWLDALYEIVTFQR